MHEEEFNTGGRYPVAGWKFSVVLTFAKLSLRKPFGSIDQLNPITLLVPISYSLRPNITVASSHLHTVKGKLLTYVNLSAFLPNLNSYRPY
jgi:hypothetical protein